MSETRGSPRTWQGSAVDLLGITVDGRTYKNLLYLILAFPLGLAYWLFLTFGFTVGLVTFVLGIGIVVLLVTVVGVRFLVRFERWLANALLGLELVAPNDRQTSTGRWSTIKRFVDAPSTWQGLGFVTVKFWLGVVGVVLLALLWNVVEMLTAPLRYPVMIEFGELDGRPIGWSIGTLPEAVLAVPLGLIGGIVLLHVSNGFAYVSGRIAAALLGESAGSAGTTTGTTPTGGETA